MASTSRAQTLRPRTTAGTFQSPSKTLGSGETSTKTASAKKTAKQVHLRIAKILLRPFTLHDPLNPQLLSTSLPNKRAKGHCYVLTGELAVLSQFGATLAWLTRITGLLFAPVDQVALYASPAHDVESWMKRQVNDADWERVNEGDPLEARIYEFKPNGPVTLARRSLRQDRSLTSIQKGDRSRTFRQNLRKRDQYCVLTTAMTSIVASHLIPKRLGDVCTREIVKFYAGNEIGETITDRFDERLGLTLVSALDERVDGFSLGFYHVEGTTYTVHNFDGDPKSVPINGIIAFNPAKAENPSTPIHGQPCTLLSHDDTIALPPAGVFNWHYLQCVISRFGTKQYHALHNSAFYEFPFRTEDDEDDDDDDFNPFDDVPDPPYPGFKLDQYLWGQAELRETAERNQSVICWIGGVEPQ